MLVRAYAFTAGEEIGADANSPFTDMAQAPAWARDVVTSAAKLGLLRGQSEERFAPAAAATRAESAQAIYQLYKKRS